MKIVALGGSAAGPNVGAGSAGFLITHNQTAIVLDLGPDTLLELRKHIDLFDLSALIISHYHLDHVLDLGSLRYFLSYGPRTATRKIPLLIPPDSEQYFLKWAATFGHTNISNFFDAVFDMSTYDPSRNLSIGDLTVTFAPTVHPMQGWAMRVSAGTGLDCGYTADTGPAADLAGHFRGVGLLIAEATETEPPADEIFAERGHLTGTEAGELAARSDAAMLMLTHMWDGNDREAAVAEAQQHFRGPITIAKPGATVYL